MLPQFFLAAAFFIFFVILLQNSHNLISQEPQFILPISFHKWKLQPTNHQINNPQSTLCIIGSTKSCRSIYLAQNLDQILLILPIYSIYSEQPLIYQNHINFENYMNNIGIRTYTIEGIFPVFKQKDFKVTSPQHPNHLQLTLDIPFYIRENLVNVGAKKIKDWEYLLYIDAHQFFLNTLWFEETIYKLEHFNFVQMFQSIYRLEQDNKTLEVGTDMGMMYGNSHSLISPPFWKQIYNLWSGNAFAFRKEVYEKLGSILDTCIGGACDCAVDLAAMNNMELWPLFDQWPNYKRELWPWIENAHKILRNKGVFVRGDLIHWYHEHGFNYGKNMVTINELNYTIARDLERDESSLLHLKNGIMREIFINNRN